MRRVKGRSSRRLMQEFGHLKKHCWGRRLWARGCFVASSGDVTDEVIMGSIRAQDVAKDDDDLKVEDA
jgi:putative transposase